LDEIGKLSGEKARDYERNGDWLRKISFYFQGEKNINPISSSTDQIVQLKVTLKRSKPPIWRRLLVSEHTNLLELHKIIQESMGWENCHLHQFIIDRDYYSAPGMDDWIQVNDEKNFFLADIISSGRKRFKYEYDFGDSWLHEIVIEKIIPADPKMKYPICVKAKRACPPEDVGGVWGYAIFLEALNDPDHEDHDLHTEWWDGTFDPEDVDIARINIGLQKVHQSDWRNKDI